MVLSIAKLAAGGQRYYLDQAQARVDHRESVASGVEDYYLAAPEAPGRWTGAEAERLGLVGDKVVDETLHRALSWSDPLTGAELQGPIAQARVPGFDLMFSVPKSASVVFGICEPDVRSTIRRAQEEAVGQALRYLESVACRGRLGRGGQGEGFAGRGFLAAAFEHRTSRAGDPQLHTHVLVANAVQRPDRLWATLDGRRIYAHAKTAGYIHEAAFRHALTRDLGIEWERPVNGIADIRGISKRVLDAFSRRSREIDAYLRGRGEGSAAARQVAAVRTREAKDYQVTPARLLPEWRERAARLGLTLERVAALIGRAELRLEPFVDNATLTDALAGRDGLTRGASHFDRRDVLQRLAGLAREGATLAELEAAADGFLQGEHAIPLTPLDARRSEVIRREDGRVIPSLPADQRYTTPAVLAAERRVLAAVAERQADGLATAQPAAIENALAERPSMGDDQARMVRRLARGGEGIQVVVGPAGSGKTFALEAARAAWEASGITVSGAAVARAAAHVLYDEAGIESTSVAALLRDLRRGHDGLPRGGVLVIDEAGMLGTLDLAEIFQHAAEARTKIVLVGDPNQLPEIDAGGCFRALAARPGAIALEENRRQRHEHDRVKVDLLRAGRPGDAMSVAFEHRDVVIAENGDELLDRIVADYCAVATDESTVMIAARRSEVAELNARARAIIDRQGRLGAQRLELAGGEFATGDRVVIKRNDRRLGVQNGNRGRVVAVDRERCVMRVAFSDGRTVALDPRFLATPGIREQPSLVHGYAATAHVMQGQTAERAFVLGSESIYREWGYVAMTRARERTVFYICDPGASAESLEESRAQRTAHELAERETIRPATTEALVRERERHGRTAAEDPTVTERRELHDLERKLDIARQALDAATARHEWVENARRGFLRRGRPDRETARRATDEEGAAAERVAGLVVALRARRADGAGARWTTEHAWEIARHRAVIEELDARAHTRQRALRHVDGPRHIVDTIGPRPEARQQRRTWDEAVHAVERYRARHGVNDPHRPLGRRDESRQLVRWTVASRNLELAARELGRAPEQQRELFR